LILLEDIQIFVEHLLITHDKPCLIHSFCYPKIDISFFLSENILEHPCSKDQLNPLYDYEAICQKIIKSLKEPIDCESESYILNIFKAIENKSTWLFKGHIDTIVTCTKSFNATKSW